jgi:hypothetical protein
MTRSRVARPLGRASHVSASPHSNATKAMHGRMLRAALVALALRCISAACNDRGARGVADLDVRRYAGEWFTQAAWGTGANSMFWCGADVQASRAVGLAFC